MKKTILPLIALLLCFIGLKAQTDEKLLYSTTFQNWATAAASTTPTTLDFKTDFSGENFSIKFSEVAIDNSTLNDLRFNYVSGTPGAVEPWGPATIGYAMCAKTATPYIEISGLASITKVSFTHGATGSSRGYRLWKKNATDADWVAVTSATDYANPASGQTVTVTINETNCALKFTNLSAANNAYLFDINIYGNYKSSLPQQTLATSVNIANAGTITRNLNSDTYDAGTNLVLTANRNFGYQFKEWRDAVTDAVVSISNPYAFAINSNTSLIAVFDPITTYNYGLTVEGSQWGTVTLTPSPTNGKYETGTIVTMTAVPNAVVNFLNWEDPTTTLTRTILVDADKSFTATFDEIPFIVGWNFKAQTPNADRAGDFYAETSNTGLFTMKNADGTSAAWLARPSSFSPAYPCIQIWSSAASFATPRYYQASFSTVGYKNIQLKSMVGASYHAYPVITLLYSIDGTNFTKLSETNITAVYNSGWADLNMTLPADAEGQSKIYIRWIADTASTPLLGNATDVDGTAITNIYVYADKEIVNDVTAPTLINTVPAEGAANASANGSIVLTFDEKLKAGTGSCTLDGLALTPSFGSKTVTFAYSKLSYNTDYTFTVPDGALTDLSGNAFAGRTVHFRTMNRPQPIAKVFDAVIAADGSGDFTTVQAAIDAVPSNSALPYLIFVKNGTYTGHVDIPATKPFIHLIGQSRDNVVIEDNRLCGEDGDANTPTYSVDPGATMVAKSSNCYFENITFSNSFGYTKQAGPQALAVFTNNEKVIFKNCWMRSYQDTYLTSSNVAARGYLLNCKIEGAVDFIYGQGDFFFDKCTIFCTRPAGGYIVAPNHGSATAWGYVFSNCTLDGNNGVVTYLGRPWHASPKTSFFNTTCKISIYPVGWYYKMGAIPAIFADYNTMDANGNPVDLSQRISEYEYDIKDANGNVTSTVKGTAKNAFTDTEAAQYTYENVTSGTDGWDPRVKTEMTDAPVVSVVANTVSWSAVDYAICYVVMADDKVVDITTSNSYQPTASVNIKVVAVSEYGALSELSNSVQIDVATAIAQPGNSLGLKIWQSNSTVEISHIPDGSSVSVYSFNGVLISSTNSVSDTFCTPVNQNIILKVKSANVVDVFKVLKR